TPRDLIAMKDYWRREPLLALALCDPPAAAAAVKELVAAAVKQQKGYAYTGLDTLARALAQPDRLAENVIRNARFTGDYEEERHTIGTGPLEMKVAMPMDKQSKHTRATQARTVMFRKRADGLAWAVRGYTVGTIVLKGKKIAAMLTDGDADGCFDRAGADRV